MPKLPNGQQFHWFKLGGKTKAAVETVIRIQKSGKKLSDEFNQEQRMELYKALGAHKPSTQIMLENNVKDAHIIWPDIFDGIDQADDNFYMAVPYDYKNEHFIPEDSEPLDDQTRKILEFKAGAAWGQKVPVLYIMEPRLLEEIPADFDEETHDFAQGCSVCSTGFKIPGTDPFKKGPK